MRKAGQLIGMCLAVLALGAATPAAPTADWLVNNTKLIGSAALARSVPVVASEHLKLLDEKFNPLVSCTASEVGIVKGELILPNQLHIKALTFTGCQSSSCKIANETVLTLPLKGLAFLDSGGFAPTYIQVLPLTSKTLAVVNFESCAMAGAVPLTEGASDIDILVHGAGTALHLSLTFSLPGLELGSSPVSIAVPDWLDLGLESSQTWSFL